MVELADIVVDASFVTEHRDDIIVCDLRWYLDGRSGVGAYIAGHIPGALFVDLDRDLSGPPGGPLGRHPFPTGESFALTLGSLGIGDDDIVVAYDDSGGGTAARLVWMLRAVGQSCALLNGGLGAWSGELQTGAQDPRPSTNRTVRPWPSSIETTIETLLERQDHAALLDARSAERYRGEVEPTPAPAGHIPGAVNLPWTELIDAETKRFLPRAQLQLRFEAAGIRPDGPFIASCGSGVSACALLVGAELAGLGSGDLFVPLDLWMDGFWARGHGWELISKRVSRPRSQLY